LGGHPYVAEEEEDMLRIGKMFKKTFSKKNMKKVGKFAEKLALDELSKQIGDEEDLIWGAIARVGARVGGQVAADQLRRHLREVEEEDLKFNFGKLAKSVGKEVGRHAFNELSKQIREEDEEELKFRFKKFMDKVGKEIGKTALNELGR
jgi:hypothetical protein